METACILEAVENGETDMVRALLDGGFDPDTPIGDAGDIVLCWAAAYGQSEIVGLLLEHGANIEAAPEHGMGGPALNDALFEGHLSIAEVLVGGGADVTYANAAALGMLERVQQHDEDHAERWDAFLSACKTGQTEVVAYLVPRGIDVGIYPPGAEYGGIGASGLHWAATGGHEALVHWLVDAGTPVDVIDDTFGNTPLGWALLDGNEQMAAVLVGLGADPILAKR